MVKPPNIAQIGLSVASLFLVLWAIAWLQRDPEGRYPRDPLYKSEAQDAHIPH